MKIRLLELKQIIREEYHELRHRYSLFNKQLTLSNLENLINKIDNIPEDLIDAAKKIADLIIDDKSEQARNLAIENMDHKWLQENIYPVILLNPADKQQRDSILLKVIDNGIIEGKRELTRQPVVVKWLARGSLVLVPNALIKVVLKSVTKNTLEKSIKQFEQEIADIEATNRQHQGNQELGYPDAPVAIDQGAEF